MSAPDIVNGLFELLGGLTTYLNIRAILRDREVRGVDWRLTFFYTAWGLWNLFYYPHLGQWASFAGGVVIVATNVVWLALVIHYKRRAARGPDDFEKWREPRKRMDVSAAEVERVVDGQIAGRAAAAYGAGWPCTNCGKRRDAHDIDGVCP